MEKRRTGENLFDMLVEVSGGEGMEVGFGKWAGC